MIYFLVLVNKINNEHAQPRLRSVDGGMHRTGGEVVGNRGNGRCIHDKISYVEKYIVPPFFDYVKKNIVIPRAR
jgi:hypothetical protein